ncbi:odorant receptor 4-like [Vespa velutina]|uniref:odorant receptor 4-like n=1 Tax=Vespa velutina TaxID=202808 RepID=UPI001FB2974F|nr:odorant receptor 4-like [Vespa velutina]
MFNPNYKEDIRYATKLNRWLLKPIGIWPKSVETSWIEIIISRIVNALCISFIGFFFISMSLYLIIDVQDIHVRLNKIGSLTFCIMTLTKYCLLIVHEKDIRYCLNYMEIDWKNARCNKERQIMLDWADFNRRLILISATFAFGGVIIYRLTIPLVSPRIVVGNLSFRPLAYPISKFVMDTRQSPMNEIMICLQCLAGLIMSAITVGSCSMLTVSTMHACSQLKILMSWLNYLVTKRPNETNDAEERLGNIVKRHVRILSFISFIQQFLQNISLVEVLGCTINMCMLEYYLIMGWQNGNHSICSMQNITYTTLILSFGYNIFIFCYVGEILAEECKKVAKEAYMIDWYRLKGRKGLSLLLIIAMSSSSNRLTAGKFVELSISSFGDWVPAVW